jgi:hypothetical protein
MPDEKPDLSTVAEALGGTPGSGSSEPDAKFESDRAAFDRLEAKYQGEGKAGDGEKPPAKKAKKQPKEAEPEGDASSDEVVDETPDVQKAREFLRLRGSVPDSVIERLTAEETLDWATSSSKNAADVDRAFMERAELQKELRELREAADAKGGEPSSAVPAPQAMDLENARSQLSEQFGDDEANALIEVLKPFQERVAQLESVIESATESNTNHIAMTNRERLSEFVPLLAESDRAWEAIEREVIALAEKNPKAFDSAEEYFDDALAALYGEVAFELDDEDDEEEPELEVDEEEEKAERKKATPTTHTKKPSHRKLPPKESSWQVFRHLNSHPGDIRGAKRAGQVG